LSEQIQRNLLIQLRLVRCISNRAAHSTDFNFGVNSFWEFLQKATCLQKTSRNTLISLRLVRCKSNEEANYTDQNLAVNIQKRDFFARNSKNSSTH
jgi:hypothetical protein